MLVTEQIANPLYEDELKEYEEKSKYGRDNYTKQPTLFLEFRTLEIVLNEEEYNAVRKGILQTFGTGIGIVNDSSSRVSPLPEQQTT